MRWIIPASELRLDELRRWLHGADLDVAGNEANFFVRDLTGGSRMPFRIRPGAPTSSVDIAASGNVGIGTASPQARLHVAGNAQIDGTTQLNGDVGIDGGLQVEGRVVELSDARPWRAPGLPLPTRWRLSWRSGCASSLRGGSHDRSWVISYATATATATTTAIPLPTQDKVYLPLLQR